MSSVPGSVTIVFQADLTAAYAAYQQFLAYVAANPPQVPLGGVPGGGAGGGGTVYNYHTVNNTYNTTRNVVANRAGGRGAGGGGGRGRGRGGGGRRGSYGGFGRFLRGYFITREAERLLADFANYNVKAGAADSDLARYKAEESLQKSLFSVPLIGPLANLASLPYRSQTEQTVQQAEAEDRQTAAMERAMQFAVGLNRQGAVDAAGPSGSDPARLQEIENRRQAEQQKVIEETRKQLEAVQKGEEQAKSAVTAAQQRYEAGSNVLAAFDPLGLSGPGARDRVLASLGIRKPDVAGEDATAEADAKRAGEVIRAQDARNRQQVEDHARHEREELEYQQQRSLEQARQRTRVAEAQYNLQPDVARADETYFSGINAVEAARHRGRPQEALQDALATRFRLLAEQRDLLNSGHVEDVQGNPFALSFGSPDLAGNVSEESKRDDLAEAIQELSGNLLPKIDQLIAELQGL